VRTIRILPEVLDDIEDAADWYEQTGGPGLGERFIDTFYRSHDNLAAHGAIHRKIYRHYRKVILRPFSYKLFYRMKKNVCVIALVIHEARDPENIYRLLDERDSYI
jgi:plasmid stabilization system protein ParE